MPSTDCAWHAIAGGLARDVGLGLGALQRHAHRVEIVLAHEQHRQLPQRRQVHAFVELAFVHRAVTEEAGGDRVAAQHLVAQRDADGQRQTAADDGVAAIEPCRRGRRCASSRRARGSSLPACRTSRPSARSCRCRGPAPGRARDRWRRSASCGCSASHHADRHRLLAVVEMQEAADLLRLVQLDALLLEMADAQHLAVSRWCTCAWSRWTLSFIVRRFPGWRDRPRASPVRAPSTDGA